MIYTITLVALFIAHTQSQKSCSSNSDCDTGYSCQGSFGQKFCVQLPACSSDTDCVLPVAPTCDTTSGTCYPSCSTDDDCTAYGLPLPTTCQTISGLQLCSTLACTTDADCTTPGLETCETTAGICIATQVTICSTNDDCMTAGLGLCYNETMICGPEMCMDSTDCITAGYVCPELIGSLSTAFCIPPCTEMNCTLGECDTSTGVCSVSSIPCSTDTDCDPQGMGLVTCDTTNGVCQVSATECYADSDCDTTAGETCQGIGGYMLCATAQDQCDPLNDGSDCPSPTNKCFDGTNFGVANFCYIGCSSDSDCVGPETCLTDTITGLQRCGYACSADGDCDTAGLTGFTCEALGLSKYCLPTCTNDDDCTTLGFSGASCDTFSFSAYVFQFCEGGTRTTMPPTMEPTSSPLNKSAAPIQYNMFAVFAFILVIMSFN